MYKFNKQHKTLFLTTNSNFNYEDTVNIVLSPEFYWVRIFDIPIAKHKDAIKVLPTFFEDFLDVTLYNFYAIKLENNQYLCFAYENSKIIDGIKKAKLSMGQIANVYFAQTEFENFQESVVKVDDKYFLFKDKIFLNIPSSLTQNLTPSFVDLDKLVLSKHKIHINADLKFLDSKTAKLLSAVFVILFVGNLVKNYEIKNSINTLTQEQENIKNKYNLLATQIQTKSVIKSLQNISTSQIKIRETILYIVDFSKVTKGKIQRFDLVENKLVIYFEDVESFDKLKDYISSKYQIFKSNQSDSIVTIGVKL